MLEPKQFNTRAGLGLVDYFVWPGHYRVRLVYSFLDAAWQIKTDSGLFWPHSWSRETFVEIAEGFLQA